MVKRCVVENRFQLKWNILFETGSQTGHALANSVICGTYFVTPDSFQGQMQWKMGFKTQFDVKTCSIS